MSRRTKATNKASVQPEPSNPYYDLVVTHWDKILKLYRMFEDKRPVMLYDVQNQMIYAHPYEEFKADLSERSQVSLEQQYEEAAKKNLIVVFVRDNEEKKLVSYSLG